MPSVNQPPMPERYEMPNHYQNFTTPPPENFNTETMQGSIQQLMSDNIGVYVVCEFLMGTGATLVRKQGVVYSSGRSYFVLYEDQYDRYVVCDIFSVKFITFYTPGQRPPANYTAYPEQTGYPYQR